MHDASIVAGIGERFEQESPSGRPGTNEATTQLNVWEFPGHMTHLARSGPDRIIAMVSSLLDARATA